MEADPRTTLGDNIAIARRRKGLSQAELGKAVGTTKGQISDWESGRNQPRLDAMVALARALETSIDMLVMGEQAFVDQVVKLAEAKFAERFAELERRIDQSDPQRRP
jgi:transcriptional regulator with XRE-family HTH domain